jgi:hypothetical protein
VGHYDAGRAPVAAALTIHVFSYGPGCGRRQPSAELSVRNCEDFGWWLVFGGSGKLEPM